MPRPTFHRRRTRRIAALLATVATILTITPPASVVAGTYTVHSCTTPSGAWVGMGGWTSAASSLVVGRDPGSASSCPTPGGSFSAQFGAAGLPVASGSFVLWTFDAPPATTISSYWYSRGFNLGWPVVPTVANRPYVVEGWHDQDQSSGLFDFQAPLQASHTLTQSTPADVEGDGVVWGSLHIGLQCWGLVGNLDCGTFPAQLTIPRATIGLTDLDAPVATASGGSLVGALPVRGVGDVAFHATDAGAGVYRSIVEVDGAEVTRSIVDDNGGRCGDVEPGNSDAYEFGTPQPCSLDVDGSVQLDTSGLRDGVHALTVSVEDAAGNVGLVHTGDITTHNAPISTTTPGLSGAARVGAQLTVENGGWDGAPTAYDRRWLRCDAAGANCTPIAGAAAATYTLTPTDISHRIVAEVTAANAGGSAAARSATSSVIADAEGNTTSLPSPGGAGTIAGLTNPLAADGTHTPNGASPAGRSRLTLAFRRADGHTARRVRSAQARSWTLVGRLTNAAGHPIAGARLTAAWQVVGRGWVAHSGSRTGADGRFVARLPAGPTRAVKLVYYAYADSRTYVSSNVVHEDVLAPLTIRSDPRQLVGTRVVHLAGRVGGRPIPRIGLLVTLQGFQAGFGWRSFRTVRTTRSGHWSARYRFRLAHGRFGFRVIVPRQGSFPYVTSTSRPVHVTVA